MVCFLDCWWNHNGRLFSKWTAYQFNWAYNRLLLRRLRLNIRLSSVSIQTIVQSAHKSLQVLLSVDIPRSTWPHWVDWAVKPQHKQTISKYSFQPIQIPLIRQIYPICHNVYAITSLDTDKIKSRYGASILEVKISRKRHNQEAQPSRDTKRRRKEEQHYENKPIQIYWKFYHQKMKIFR